MPIVLAPNQIHTEVHPGEYEIQVIHGGPVAYYKDGELPESVSNGHAKVTTEGRLNVLASDHALVSVEALLPNISPAKVSDSPQAIPETSKAAGETAADPDQAPIAGKAKNASPSSARTKGAKTNRPTTSEEVGAVKDSAGRKSR